MDMQWRFSSPVDSTLLHKAGIFTLLPVRRHKDANIAKEAMEDVLRDYRNIFGDGREKNMPLTMTKDGEMNVFLVPEALPERLALTTWLNAFGILHDDLTEPMDQASALEQSRDFDKSLDIHFQTNNQRGRHVGSYKKIMSRCLYELIRVDREVGVHVLDLTSKAWLQKTHQSENFSCQTWEDFVKRRVSDAGLKAFFAIVEFASGFHILKSERQLSEPLLETLGKVGTLVNDYFSYDREAYLHRMNGTRIFNSIHFLIEQKSLSVKSAKSQIRATILELERQFLREKDEFYRKYPSLTSDHKRHIEHCEAAIGGAHYWCAIADRYHYWKSLPGAFLEEETSLTPLCEHSGPSGNKSNGNRVRNEDTINSRDSEDGNVAGKRNHHIQCSRAENDMVETEKETTKKRKVLAKTKTNNGAAEILDDRVVQAPYEYLISLPAKGVRRTLIDNLGEWLSIPEKSKEIITTIIDLLHNSSLMLDDVEDGSDLRRGSPASHMVFGQAQTINTATFIFVRAVQEAQGLNSTDGVRVLSEHLEHLFIGQSWDIHWREQLICPTETQYLKMIGKKTGGLFQLLVDLMQLESQSSVYYDLDALVQSLGQYFQIRDDYINLVSEQYCEQKGFCEDLDKGKISYPLVMCACADQAYADRILGIFRQHAFSSRKTLQRQTKVYILKLLEESGALNATRTKLEELEADIDQEIEHLEDVIKTENPMLKILVEMLRI